MVVNRNIIQTNPAVTHVNNFAVCILVIIIKIIKFMLELQPNRWSCYSNHHSYYEFPTPPWIAFMNSTINGLWITHYHTTFKFLLVALTHSLRFYVKILSSNAKRLLLSSYSRTIHCYVIRHWEKFSRHRRIYLYSKPE